MYDQSATADSRGLHFFGVMTASISHELKNALAIINENAGLLGDLALLAEKGRPLEPERLKVQAERIRQQVRRADDIIRRLNRFAHSAHEGPTGTDIYEVLEFTLALAARLAAMKSVSLTVQGGPPLQLEVRLFQLGNLLWLYLQQVLAVVPDGPSGVVFAASDAGEAVMVSLRCDKVPATTIVAAVEQEGQPLLMTLGATVHLETDTLLLRIPKRSQVMR
ncbi:histidine kinase dimerization/phospho-acceptor domain-containing protein [Desulfobulbus oligotrophicus]|uniref:histidine kinase n=1 Tax=Desulfobulbus oligotrophicus TaxID=1909699 RepID=A0A7T6APT4_9BACT|nr:histidine kinase dimerization/phospho-acceptor domain-containing protein [Desulfobulbus oligotrophicus]QQG65003.1 sensor histidine kinase [Desulfobulbus oligotrophicus]